MSSPTHCRDNPKQSTSMDSLDRVISARNVKVSNMAKTEHQQQAIKSKFRLKKMDEILAAIEQVDAEDGTRGTAGRPSTGTRVNRAEGANSVKGPMRSALSSRGSRADQVGRKVDGNKGGITDGDKKVEVVNAGYGLSGGVGVEDRSPRSSPSPKKDKKISFLTVATSPEKMTTDDALHTLSPNTLKHLLSPEEVEEDTPVETYNPRPVSPYRGVNYRKLSQPLNSMVEEANDRPRKASMAKNVAVEFANSGGAAKLMASTSMTSLGEIYE